MWPAAGSAAAFVQVKGNGNRKVIAKNEHISLLVPAEILEKEVIGTTMEEPSSTIATSIRDMFQDQAGKLYPTDREQFL